MTLHPIGPHQDVPNRPGMRLRSLVGSQHGFDSMFVTDAEMDVGSSIPLHTHTVEEAWVIMAGALTVRIGEETVVVPEGNVVRVPPNVPHAVVNAGTDTARAFTASPHDRATFFRDATTYLEGERPG